MATATAITDLQDRLASEGANAFGLPLCSMSSNVLTGELFLDQSENINVQRQFYFIFYYNIAVLAGDVAALMSGGGLGELFGIIGPVPILTLPICGSAMTILVLLDPVEAHDGRADRHVIERDLRQFRRRQARRG